MKRISQINSLFLFLTSLISFLLPISVYAAPFTIQTGYYSGDGSDDRAITGIGFTPDLVMIKDDTPNGTVGIVLKTSAMGGEAAVALSETDAVLTTNRIQSLDADGFTIGTDPDVNGNNVGQHWTAIGGSDCSATGTFCVGSYGGTGVDQSITTVGFQPDLVVVKRAGATSWNLAFLFDERNRF